LSCHYINPDLSSLFLCLYFLFSFLFFFFFNDTPTTEIYTLSLHDALPIWRRSRPRAPRAACRPKAARFPAGSRSRGDARSATARSEEHTSELQSRGHLVCRLLLEKKKKRIYTI